MSSQQRDNTKREGHSMDNEEYILRKRLPRRMPTRKNDVYVSRKTNFVAQLARCEKLFDEGGHNEIYIHGLGAAVDRAMNLALKLKEQFHHNLGLAVNTSAVELIDDLEPKSDSHEPDTQSRNSSAVHIKVYKIDEYHEKSAIK